MHAATVRVAHNCPTPADHYQPAHSISDASAVASAVSELRHGPTPLNARDRHSLTPPNAVPDSASGPRSALPETEETPWRGNGAASRLQVCKVKRNPTGRYQEGLLFGERASEFQGRSSEAASWGWGRGAEGGKRRVQERAVGARVQRQQPSKQASASAAKPQAKLGLAFITMMHHDKSTHDKGVRVRCPCCHLLLLTT